MLRGKEQLGLQHWAHAGWWSWSHLATCPANLPGPTGRCVCAPGVTSPNSPSGSGRPLPAPSQARSCFLLVSAAWLLLGKSIRNAFSPRNALEPALAHLAKLSSRLSQGPGAELTTRQKSQIQSNPLDETEETGADGSHGTPEDTTVSSHQDGKRTSHQRPALHVVLRPSWAPKERTP